jgi:hypothetical protein
MREIRLAQNRLDEKGKMCMHYTRILKVVESCKTFEHIDACINMVKNYSIRFGSGVNSSILFDKVHDKKKEIQCQIN